jgi:tRNA A37 methylthiotransferase MiaB
VLIALGEELRKRYIQSLDGSVLQLLVETPDAENPQDAWAMADRYVSVLVRGGSRAIGELLQGSVRYVDRQILMAEETQPDAPSGGKIPSVQMADPSASLAR